MMNFSKFLQSLIHWEKRKNLGLCILGIPTPASSSASSSWWAPCSRQKFFPLCPESNSLCIHETSLFNCSFSLNHEHALLDHPWDFPGKSTGVGCHYIILGKTKNKNQYTRVYWNKRISSNTFIQRLNCKDYKAFKNQRHIVDNVSKRIYTMYLCRY